jgi:hypothetical protein
MTCVHVRIHMFYDTYVLLHRCQLMKLQVAVSAPGSDSRIGWVGKSPKPVFTIRLSTYNVRTDCYSFSLYSDHFLHSSSLSALSTKGTIQMRKDNQSWCLEPGQRHENIALANPTTVSVPLLIHSSIGNQVH